MKILVVEDDVEAGAYLERALRRLGHLPLLASHPQDALALLISDEVDLVISDIDLPGMDGVELARAIRRLDAEMPIAFCTGSDRAGELVREAEEIGCVLPKLRSLSQVQGLVASLRREAPQRTPRASRRFHCCLSVRFRSARQLREAYTENISNGGLFVSGATQLEPGQEVSVHVELPGLDTYLIAARVAYVTPPASDRERGLGGAGLQIIGGPPAFFDALRYCIHRLEHRRGFAVLATDPEVRRLLAEAGYRALPAPPPAGLTAALDRCELPVVAVVVSRVEEPAYQRAALAAGEPALIHAIDFLEEIDTAMAAFDISFAA
jgi:CheY-like chemotaxis protein